MFFHSLYKTSGYNPMHSPDLTDMRRAILDDDDDGPDGGTLGSAPSERTNPAPSQQDIRRPM